MVAGVGDRFRATPEPNVTAFPSFGSSGYEPLSLALCTVNGIVTVAVQQSQVLAAVIAVIAVTVVKLNKEDT